MAKMTLNLQTRVMGVSSALRNDGTTGGYGHGTDGELVDDMGGSDKRRRTLMGTGSLGRGGIGRTSFPRKHFKGDVGNQILKLPKKKGRFLDICPQTYAGISQSTYSPPQPPSTFTSFTSVVSRSIVPPSPDLPTSSFQCSGTYHPYNPHYECVNKKRS